MIRVVGFCAGLRDKVHGTDQITYFLPEDQVLVDELPDPDTIKRHAISCGYEVAEGRFDFVYRYVDHAHVHRVRQNPSEGRN